MRMKYFSNALKKTSFTSSKNSTNFRSKKSNFSSPKSKKSERSEYSYSPDAIKGSMRISELSSDDNDFDLSPPLKGKKYPSSSASKSRRTSNSIKSIALSSSDDDFLSPIFEEEEESCDESDSDIILGLKKTPNLEEIRSTYAKYCKTETEIEENSFSQEEEDEKQDAF